MKWSDFYSGDFVTAEQLGHRKIKGKIVSCVPETRKFQGKDEATALEIEVSTLDGILRLNKTNARRLAKAYGDDPKKWVGKIIEVYAEDTQYMGEATKGVRVKPIGGKK